MLLMPRNTMIGFLALNKMHSACKYPGPTMLFKEDEAQFALHNFYYEWLQRMEALVTFSCKLHSWKSKYSVSEGHGDCECPPFDFKTKPFPLL